jgi:hypothetical protein
MPGNKVVASSLARMLDMQVQAVAHTLLSREKGERASEPPRLVAASDTFDRCKKSQSSRLPHAASLSFSVAQISLLDFCPIPILTRDQEQQGVSVRPAWGGACVENIKSFLTQMYTHFERGQVYA